LSQQSQYPQSVQTRKGDKEAIFASRIDQETKEEIHAPLYLSTSELPSRNGIKSHSTWMLYFPAKKKLGCFTCKAQILVTETLVQSKWEYEDVGLHLLELLGDEVAPGPAGGHHA
jgi:hypothetical protein